MRLHIGSGRPKAQKKRAEQRDTAVAWCATNRKRNERKTNLNIFGKCGVFLSGLPTPLFFLGHAPIGLLASESDARERQPARRRATEARQAVRVKCGKQNNYDDNKP